MEQQISIHDLLCGKTYPEHSAATEDRTSGQCFRRSAASAENKPMLFLNLRRDDGFLPDASWETVGALPGVSTMLSTGECPSEERGSTLSQILQENAPEKYFLSPRACAGILRRAEKRGKILPDMFKEALMEVVGCEG